MAHGRGTSSGKGYSSGARGREKRLRGKGRGEHKTRGEEKQDKGSGGKPDGGKPDSSQGTSAKCERCGEAGPMTVRCPDQICGVCGGKGHSAEICANVDTVLACVESRDRKDGSDATISGEEAEAFIMIGV